MEKKKNTSTSYSEEQMKDAEQFCSILNSVPSEKRGMFVAIVTAYVDGIVAGEAIAAEAGGK